ncbi:MAG: Gfo/Idh/MocA family oxidoreductase [Candidatus Latescibacteria bacterium]|nr:Gfo/Idh/MocA family oxidoreductase [Candidatus Latescibacterota bacterium]
MAEPLPLAMVGCGGMGHRHLYGLAELQRAGRSPFVLVGACDPVLDNANSLADQAADLLGRRPAVAKDLDGLPAEVRAVDVCTLPAFHHTSSIAALERGWHVMCEKPMGLTLRACQAMIRAARQAGRVLSVAENYRRDPINRLARALIDAGILGQPRLLIHNTLGGGDQMLISVWRHQKNASGILLDVGVHFADIMEYFLGPALTAYAQTRLHEPIRHNPVAGKDLAEKRSPAGVYERWQKQMPAQFEATAEDAAYATILFASGAVAQYIEDHAIHGQGLWQRTLYGSRGSMNLPGDRSGQRLQLTLAGKEPLDDQRLLDLVPGFCLDPTTAALFGGERLYEYRFPFPEIDRKLIAVEYAEFGEVILHQQTPEVGAELGARAVALSYALLESQVAGRAVSVAEVLEDRLNAYQAEINASLGL